MALPCSRAFSGTAAGARSRPAACARSPQPFCSAPPRRCAPRAAPEDGGEDLSDLLKDLERFQQRSGAAGASAPAGPSRTAAGPAAAARAGGGGAEAGGGAAKELLDKLLIADFFFVVLALAWLAAGLGAQGALHSSALLDAWFPLWPLVFQPAIGVLMLGALVSGGLGWLKEQEEKKGA